jgi:hypothetical protein
MTHLSHPPFKLTDEHIKIARHVHFHPTENGFEVDPEAPYISMVAGPLRMEPELAIAKILDIQPSEGEKYSQVQMGHFKQLHIDLAHALYILLDEVPSKQPGYYVKVTFDVAEGETPKKDAPFFWDRLSPAEYSED